MNENKMRVKIATKGLHEQSSVRGIGVYTRNLTQALQERNDVEIVDEKYDLIHYPFFDFFFSTLPLRNKAPTVVTIHDVIPLVFPKAYPRGKRGAVALLRQRLALQGVRAVITDSHASKNDIHRHLRIPLKKIHVTYLAAGTEFAPATPKNILRAREEFQLPAKYILYVGDINYNKNLAQLVKALKYLPDDIDLVCVGKNFFPQEIPEWKAIETQIALSDVAERVHFLTEIPADQNNVLSSLYSGAVAYVQPSLYEGFGLPVLEAMACRAPVVCARNSSLIEVGGEDVVFVETDAESIAQGVQEVLSWSDQKRSRWTKKAQEWSQQFTWAKTAQETLEVYKSVLK